MKSSKAVQKVKAWAVIWRDEIDRDLMFNSEAEAYTIFHNKESALKWMGEEPSIESRIIKVTILLPSPKKKRKK